METKTDLRDQSEIDKQDFRGESLANYIKAGIYLV